MAMNLQKDSIETYLESLISKAVLYELQRVIPQLQPKQDEDRLFTIEQLQDYLPEKPAKQTIYGWICNRKIPYQKFGKRLFFRQSVIDVWTANGRKVK